MGRCCDLVALGLIIVKQYCGTGWAWMAIGERVAAGDDGYSLLVRRDGRDERGGNSRNCVQTFTTMQEAIGCFVDAGFCIFGQVMPPTSNCTPMWQYGRGGISLAQQQGPVLTHKI
jgi:hypothetical protein